MATQRTAEVEWSGGLIDGKGTIVSSTSGSLPELEVTWDARNDEAISLTSPEELIAAAHASCFSMAFAAGLVGGGFEPQKLEVSATVSFEAGVGITTSQLVVRGAADGASDQQFRETAERAKVTCPVSRALAGIEITLELPDLPEEAGEPKTAEAQEAYDAASSED
jgi:osmotically inducible protein OsmC